MDRPGWSRHFPHRKRTQFGFISEIAGQLVADFRVALSGDRADVDTDQARSGTELMLSPPEIVPTLRVGPPNIVPREIEIEVLQGRNGARRLVDRVDAFFGH